MRPITLLLLLWSVIGVALRLEAAHVVDFGDSEALYAAYSLFPAPAFLDHPGLIGKLYGLFGKPPDANSVHTATALLASLFPWFLRAALRFASGDPKHSVETKQRHADRASLIALWFSMVPVVSVGLFALTPDWPLAVCLVAGLGFALRAEHEADRRSFNLFAAGALIALAGYGKLTGFAFVLALAWAWRKQKARAGYLGLAVGLVPSLEIALYEARTGFPMLSHRLAPSLLGIGKGLGMATFGQLLYLSPVVAVLVVWFARRVIRAGGLLATMLVVPGVLLLVAAALSPQAEPHWMAPLLVPLAFAAYGNPDSDAEQATLARWSKSTLVRVAFGLGAVLTLVTYGWVLTPKTAKWIPEKYRHDDISRELFGQNVLRDALLRSAREHSDEGVTPVFVGPHWTLCARLRLVLPQHRYDVGCVTREEDDFDHWAKDVWVGAPLVVWVTDDRFEDVDTPSPAASVLPAALAGYTQLSMERVVVFRGGMPSRTFVWRVLAQPGAKVEVPVGPAVAPVPTAGPVRPELLPPGR